MQTILDGIFFVYALTNTNYFLFLVIKAILLAKSDVNGLKDKVTFCRFELKKWQKTPKNGFKNI